MAASSSEMVAGVVFLSILAAVPVFSVLAYHEWLRHTRRELPSWRNLLGVLSISSTFLSWLGYASTIAISFSRLSSYSSPEAVFGTILMLTLAGMCSSFAWKGKARRWAVTAACLMMAFCAWFYFTGTSIGA